MKNKQYRGTNGCLQCYNFPSFITANECLNFSHFNGDYLFITYANVVEFLYLCSGAYIIERCPLSNAVTKRVEQWKEEELSSILHYKRDVSVCLSVCASACGGRHFSQRWPNGSSSNFQRFSSECRGVFSVKIKMWIFLRKSEFFLFNL